jgi:catechol 2,3-dioxygenase-like lactoylglutathione lyase family enzyme
LTQAASLGYAIMGCSSLEGFVAFYGGELGMDASPETRLEGPGFERLWDRPEGSSARAVVMSVGGSPLGQVLGIEFAASQRIVVADSSRGPFIGYWNVNFYVDDIFECVPRLEDRGFRFWTRPVRNIVANSAGAPIEAIFLGPHNVAINLLELDGAVGSEVGRIVEETKNLPRSRTGFSQVATSAHATNDVAAAAAFYREVLGMVPAIDAVLESADVNALTGRPRDARTHVMWMRGDHPYGKIALSQPLNYVLRDLTPRAVAPNAGYLAQSFAMPDLDLAIAAAATLGVTPICQPQTIALPGSGRLRAVMLRSPGSGALIQLTDK